MTLTSLFKTEVQRPNKILKLWIINLAFKHWLGDVHLL